MPKTRGERLKIDWQVESACLPPPYTLGLLDAGRHYSKIKGRALKKSH